MRNNLDPRLKAFAHTMRREPSEPEKRLWRLLSGSKLGGYKFRRQHALGNFILDFYCPQINLAIEVDGDTHDPAADCNRDQQLALRGVRVIRFTNGDVMTNMDGVAQVILATAADLPDRQQWRRVPTPTQFGPVNRLGDGSAAELQEGRG